jgi:hypothetical protein
LGHPKSWSHHWRRRGQSRIDTPYYTPPGPASQVSSINWKVQDLPQMLISSPSCACGHHTPPGAALQSGLEDPAVKDRRRGLGPSPLGPGVEHPQGVAHGFKSPSSQPAPGSADRPRAGAGSRVAGAAKGHRCGQFNATIEDSPKSWIR